MRLCLALGGMLALLVACSGEDLSSDGGAGGQGGAGSSQGGQAGSTDAGGQGPAGASGSGEGGTSGGSGQPGAGAGGAPGGAAGAAGAAGGSATGGVSGAAGDTGVAGGGQGGESGTGQAFGPGGSSGASGQGGASTAGQGGSAGQAGNACLPGKECDLTNGHKGLCDAKGQCQPTVADIGCADGTREGFAGINKFPDIAACSGAWTKPGITVQTQCAKSGNSGPIPDGQGCTARDLCAATWHICESADEVFSTSKMKEPCAEALASVDGAAMVFYATGQSGKQEDTCTANGTNNVYGCGFGGAQMDCGVLTGVVGVGKLPLYPGWAFDTSQVGNVSALEKQTVTKVSGPGGVLCCRN